MSLVVVVSSVLDAASQVRNNSTQHHHILTALTGHPTLHSPPIPLFSTLGRIPLDPHSLDPHSLDPHSLDPHSLDPHSQDPLSTPPHSTLFTSTPSQTPLLPLYLPRLVIDFSPRAVTEPCVVW
ncbi:hypothetical protein VKT23_017673 [Stygiomarasmius scandens]|uniref:Uncharacterized protein n=1 Tax=Marasmiellus scandens TaxID=2682957 RepID=A0ABR1IUS4_9AGAR